jgi:hypothetical protein
VAVPVLLRARGTRGARRAILSDDREDDYLKLAEALAERGDCQKRIEEVRKRLTRSARVQEGEQPAENPSELLAELSDAIAERDAVGKKRDALAQLAEAASTRQDRHTKSEVKFVATVSVAELQKQADRLSREFRELDTGLQELNWKTDIV